MKTTTFLQSELWGKIKGLAKRSKRKDIAVAYLGSGASKLISLGKGDTLVVDMSSQAVKSGQTNPFEVEKYIESGVEAFSCANLHAKVYLFDKTAVISSGNLSIHSQNALVEAGVVTQEPTVLKSARGFIKSIQVEPITPEYLKLRKQQYRPPEFSDGGNHRQHTKEVVPAYSRLWLNGIEDVKLSEEEERISERESEKAVKEIKDKRRHEVNSIRWQGNSPFTRTVQKGDLMILIWNGKVYPPCRVVRISKKYQLSNIKTPRFFILVEQKKKPKLFRWLAFKKTLSQVGLAKLTPGSTREVKSPTASHMILGLWG